MICCLLAFPIANVIIVIKKICLEKFYQLFASKGACRCVALKNFLKKV